MSRRFAPAFRRSLRFRVHCPQSEISYYRVRTVALLRRFLRMSVEIGRLPALLGREFFRSSVTTLRVPTFEDIVIFVYDIERCISLLNAFDQQLIARIVLQEYTRDEAAFLLHCDRRTITRRYPQALDRLSRMLLDRGLLAPYPSHVVETTTSGGACQVGKTRDFSITDCKQRR